MHKKRRQSGFTLAELLIGLMVSSVILAAAATIAHAMNSAESITENMHKNQAVLRYASVRFRDLIRMSNTARAFGGEIQLWADMDYDGAVDASEQFSIKKGVGSTSIVLSSSSGDTTIVPECSNIVFVLVQDVMVTIMFDMEVNGATNTYQISGALLCKDDHI